MKRIAVILLWLALMLPLAAETQEDTLGLSAPDALMLAAANSAELNSFAFEYQFQFAVNLETFTAATLLRGSGAVDREANALSTTITGELKPGTTPVIPLEAEVRWIDDTLYLNMGDGWQALENMPAALSNLIGGFTGLSVDPEALSAWNFMGIDGLDDLLTTIAGADPSTFVTAERLDDDAESARFRFTADLHALFDTDAFVDAIIALGGAQGSDLMIYSRDEVAEMLRANNQAVDPAMLILTQFIGLDDNLIHQIAVNMTMEIAPERAGFSSPPFTVDLRFDMTLTEHNQPQEIFVPDSTVVVPELTMTMATPAVPNDGVTRTVSIEMLDENATYVQAFDLQAGDSVTITARRLSLDFDTVLSLVAPNGETVIDNDDHESSAYFASAYDSQIFNYVIPATGSYSVEVNELDGVAGSFMLTVNVER